MATTKATNTPTTASPTKPSPLHLKYRPRDWDEVMGQAQAVKAMARQIKERSSQAFLLTGPSGCGKTTLARIGAKHWGCAPEGIIDIDAATNSGIDNVRMIQDLARSSPWGKLTGRAMIVDEAHGLSRQSWDALLKSIEEPPDHCVWFLCTTNPTKVPATIKTRCTPILLKSIADKQLLQLLEDICGEEEFEIPDEVADVVVAEAQGSARQMLVNLDACKTAETSKQAKELLHRGVMTDAVLELCRFLMRPGSWPKMMAIVNRIDNDSHEGTRIVVSNYFGAVARNAKSDRDAMRALQVLEHFATSYNQADGIAPLLLSCGRVLMSSDDD